MDPTRVSLLQGVTDPNDHKAWAELVSLYEPFLLNFLMSRKRVPESDARDIVQDIFIKLIHQLRTFQYDRSKGRFRSWLWTLAYGVMVDYYRRENRIRRGEKGWQPPAGEDEDEHWTKDHDERLLQFAMEQVKADTVPKTWQCFEEHILKGRKGAEVGGEVELPANTVYVNAKRVMERVRQRVTQLREDLDQ